VSGDSRARGRGSGRRALRRATVMAVIDAIVELPLVTDTETHIVRRID
jgi:hypothetical protein